MKLKSLLPRKFLDGFRDKLKRCLNMHEQGFGKISKKINNNLSQNRGVNMEINGIEIETEIDKNDLPKTIVTIFKMKCRYKTEMIINTKFFIGDNGKTYAVNDYSLFLGMTKNALSNRIRVAGENYKRQEILLYDKKRHTKYSNPGSPYNTKPTRTKADCEKKLMSMPGPTKYDNMFYPKREVKDKSVTAKDMTLYPDPPPEKQELKYSLAKLKKFNRKKVREGVIAPTDFRDKQSAHIEICLKERSQ